MGEPGAAPVDDGVDAEERLIGALFSAAGRRDPHPFYRSVSVPGCRYAVAEAMLRDRRFRPRPIPPSQSTVWQMYARWLLALDGQRHARMRRQFAGLFSPRRVETFRDVVTQKAAGLIDELRGSGSVDLVTDFARPLPFSVIVHVLGVPPDRREWIADRMFALDEGFARQTEPEFLARADAAVAEMLDYFTRLLDERALNPKDDLISALAADIPEDVDGHLDVIANCVFFIAAGHITTTSLIAGGTLLLLEHPDQLERLRADSSLITGAVEEMLRLVAPVPGTICRAREDLELEGYRFPSGVDRRVLLAAANRDPTVFSGPDRFEITREPNRHLTFSAGSHFCLGAPLARLHGEIAITTLLESLPNLRLDGAPVWRSSFPLRELERLPVAWGVG